MESKKIPLVGGCHCGATRYVLFFTLPTPFNEANPPKQDDQKVFRCNCTSCHKMGNFHLWPEDMINDFLLLSPLDPANELGDYLTGDNEIHFYFCKTCGVRCFTYNGLGAPVDIDAEALGLPEAAIKGPRPTKAWKATPGTGAEWGLRLLVNGHSIDAGQGFSMRELTEKKCVRYLDTFSDWGKGEPPRWDRPQEEGCY